MARALTTALKLAFLAGHVRLVLFFEGEFSSGTVRAWSGLGEKTWNGQTWQGLGYLGGITPLPENAEGLAEGIEVSLSGIPNSLLATALTEVRQGLPGTLWIAALDETEAVIADPYLAFGGRIDSCVIEEGRETSTIRISIESELLDLKRPRTARYTHEDQQSRFAGDKGFEYVEQLQNWAGQWGAPGTGAPRGLGPGGAGAGPSPRKDEFDLA